MSNYKLTKAELINHFKNHLEKLEILCKSYDEGKTHMAQDLAAKLRVLFKNTQGQTKSLLHQLHLEHVPFISTNSEYSPTNIISHYGLLSYGFGKNVMYLRPRIDDAANNVRTDFESWWNEEWILVIKDSSNHILLDNIQVLSNKSIFTRKKLVLAVSEQDGGGHVDANLNKDYYDVSRNKDAHWVRAWSNDTEEVSINEPVAPSIRQIAYEMLETFKNIDISTESRITE